MSETVLDASALLALIYEEAGCDAVARHVPGASISAVNLSEVAAKLRERGLSGARLREALGALGLEVHSFGVERAFGAAELRPLAKPLGLGLGDRACLDLGQRLGLPVLTAERGWLGLGLRVEVQVIR